MPVLKSLHKALPDAFYDVHLMISHPLQYAEPFIKAGATLYNFHLECEDDIQATIDAVRALGCKVGLTIKPGTPAQHAAFPTCWRWTAAWMPPPHPCAWKPAPTCWWRAVPCSALPTPLRLWAHWPACKEGCIWMKL